jgi:hypothetical protein
MSKTRFNKTDYLRMPMGKNNRFLNFGNRFLAASNPLLRPVVKGIRKTAKVFRNKSQKVIGKFNKSKRFRK